MNGGIYLLLRRSLAAAAGLLCACADLPPAPDEAQGVQVPAGWSAVNDAGGNTATPADLVDWWRRFGETELDTWERLALRDSPRIASAQAALAQAQAERDVVAGGLSPTLGAVASAQREDASGAAAANSFQLGLQAAWVPDLFGARRAELSAAQSAVQAAAAGLGDVQVQVAAEVALAYLGLRSAQVRGAIARDNLASQRDTLQITRWRLQAGLVTTLELSQAQSAVAQTEAVVPALDAAITQSRHALAVLAGAPPADGLSMNDGIGPPALPVGPEGLALEIPAQALRQRADVRAAEHQVVAAWARVDQAQAQRWPSFALSGSVGLNALALGSLASNPSVVGSLLASMSLPLLDGGSLRAQVRVQQAAYEQARQAHRTAVIGALRDVEDALVGLQRDRLRLTSLRTAATAAAQASLLARQRYRSGLVDFQTVLETQRTQSSAQDAVVSAGTDLGNGHVTLFKALGGGWRETPGPAPQRPLP
jgi:outer membrane protein, multidrug efflux system